MAGNNYLVTWFYAEPEDDESFYPQVGGNTSSPEFQEVYWKCVYCFYRSALLTQQNVKYLFITNVPNIPTQVGSVNLARFLEEAGVEVVRLELTNKTPKDWAGAWRNQLYVFDILKYLSSLEGNFCILDSDCLLRKDLTPVFRDIEEHGIISYRLGYEADHDINGASISQMRELCACFYPDDMPGGGAPRLQGRRVRGHREPCDCAASGGVRAALAA